jgi:hypothetical protein
MRPDRLTSAPVLRHAKHDAAMDVAVWPRSVSPAGESGEINAEVTQLSGGWATCTLSPPACLALYNASSAA